MKKHGKKFVCLALSLVFAVSVLCGCRKDADDADEIPSGIIVNPASSDSASPSPDSKAPTDSSSSSGSGAATSEVPTYGTESDRPGDDTNANTTTKKIDASGSFKSNTGSKYLNVLTKWTAKSTADGVLFTADLYLTSWTVYCDGRSNHRITIGGKTQNFTSEYIEVHDQYAESHLATVTQLLPAGTTGTDVEVEFYYGGVYGGVEYDWITVSQTLSFVQ